MTPRPKSAIAVPASSAGRTEEDGLRHGHERAAAHTLDDPPHDQRRERMRPRHRRKLAAVKTMMEPTK